MKEREGEDRREGRRRRGKRKRKKNLFGEKRKKIMNKIQGVLVQLLICGGKHRNERQPRGFHGREQHMTDHCSGQQTAA